jgi:putative LysE/RhtB family amino acid efflux pump
MDVMVGFVMGVAVVAPLGPISLLLIAIGLERGRHDGVLAGLGVAGADVVLLVIVLALSSRLAGIDPGWQHKIQVVLGVGLGAFGVHALVDRRGAAAVVDRINRPALALAVATMGNPMTLTVWLGLVVSLGGEFGGGWALARVGLGLALATLTWHVGLGAAAGSLGGLLGDRQRLMLQRVSGLVMVAMAVALLR